MPISKTLVLKNGRRKDVTALRAEEFIKWANQQTSHKLSRVDENLIVRKRISGWLCFIWGTPKILRSIGLTNQSIAMLLYVNSRLIGLRNDKVTQDHMCCCCYCEIDSPNSDDVDDDESDPDALTESVAGSIPHVSAPSMSTLANMTTSSSDGRCK